MAPDKQWGQSWYDFDSLPSPPNAGGLPTPELVFSHLLAGLLVLLRRVLSPLRLLCVTHSSLQ